MIQRRRPIESAIAKRRMFNMGGMAAPMQQMQPMGMPQQPMGMPQQAQGIMASSQPLVDAIAADAANPAGGDTLSMAQGGAVGFANGGVQYDPSNPLTMGGSPAERLQTLFPLERGAGALDNIGIGKGPGEAYPDASKSFTSKILGLVPGRVGSFLQGAATASGNVANVVDSFLGQRFRGQKDILRYLFSDEEEASGRSFSERRALSEIISRISPELKQQDPDIERNIMEIASSLIGKTGSAEEYAQQISNLYANQQEAGYAMALGDANRGRVDAVSDEGFPAIGGGVLDEVDAEAYTTDTGNLNNKIEEYRIAMGQGPGAQMQFAQDLSIDPNYTQEFKDAVLQSADAGPPVDAGFIKKDLREEYDGVDVENTRGPLDEVGAEAYKNQINPLKSDNPAVPEKIVNRVQADNLNPFSTKMTGDVEGFEGSVIEDVRQDPSGHANQRDTVTTGGDGKILKDSGANPFSLEAAVQEFTDAMPGYERSEETAGYNIILLGAAIAAGESPNAVKNIAKGVQQALPAIIKDQKEAEAYLRSVKMAGTKYALGKRDKLEAEKRAGERAKNTYYLDKDVTVTRPDGQAVTYKQGWNRFNDGTVNEINTITNQALTPLSAWNAAQAASAAAVKAQGSGYEKSTSVKARLNDKFEVDLKVQFPTPAARARGAQPVVLNPSSLTNSYFEAVGNNDSLLSLANSSADLLGKTDQKVTGFNQIAGRLYDVQKAYLGDKAPNLLKSAAITDQDGATTYARTQADFSDANRYNTQLRFLAIQMAPLLLGESGKTISDGDRRLIAEALGMAERKDGKFTWIQSASISRGELLYKVNQIQTVLRRARTDLDNNFSGIVKDYGGQMPEQRAITSGSQGATGRTLSPLVLTKDKDDQGRPIYDIRRRVR